MKIVVTGTRGIPNIMGVVETHCEELFPRVAKRGEDIVNADVASQGYEATEKETDRNIEIK